MRSLPLILAAIFVLLAAGAAWATPSQAPNQNGGSGQVPDAPPNQDGGSGSVPTPPPRQPATRTPVPPPTQTETPTPAATASPAPVTPGPAAPAPASPKPKRGTVRGLTATVTRLQGCLPQVTRRDARVLVLRAGIGRSEPTSRSRIATALDLSASRVARSERSGLRRLKQRADDGGCESNRGAAERVVRDAMAALRSDGESAGGDGQLAESARSRDLAPVAVSDREGRELKLLLGLLAGLLAFALVGRGLLKAPPD